MADLALSPKKCEDFAKCGKEGKALAKERLIGSKGQRWKPNYSAWKPIYFNRTEVGRYEVRWRKTVFLIMQF